MQGVGIFQPLPPHEMQEDNNIVDYNDHETSSPKVTDTNVGHGK
jgi:hypothetical protein